MHLWVEAVHLIVSYDDSIRIAKLPGSDQRANFLLLMEFTTHIDEVDEKQCATESRLPFWSVMQERGLSSIEDKAFSTTPGMI